MDPGCLSARGEAFILNRLVMVTSTFTRARLTRIGVPAAVFLGLTLLRTHDITRTFWMFGDQIRYWESSLLPLSQQPLGGIEAHVGVSTLGPTYYWLVWLSRVTLGPFFDNLPHAGAIAQVVLHSAIDALLLLALWTKTRSVWLALAATLFISTAPYDLALSATLWNPSLASAAVKGATALVLIGWPERSLVGVGLVAGLAWVSLHFHVPVVFCVASIFVSMIAAPLLGRDYRAVSQRAAVMAGVVAVLQLPSLVHRLSIGPGNEVDGAAVTGSLGQMLSGAAPLRVAESAAGLARAVNRIQVDPWQAEWIGWVVLACAVIVLVRHRDDVPLLAVTVLPLGVSVVGYALWVGTFDVYYYLSQMTAVVLTVLLAATAVARHHARYVAIAALALAVAILPARVRQAGTIHKMPEYDTLVDGSRQIANRGVPVRAIRADFLPPGGNSEFLFTVLGGTLDPSAAWVASIATDGLVSYELVSPQ